MQFESHWPAMVFLLASCISLPAENSMREETSSMPTGVARADQGEEDEVTLLEVPEGMDPEIAKLYRQALYEDLCAELVMGEGPSEMPAWLARRPDSQFLGEHQHDLLAHHIAYLAAPRYGEDYGYVLCQLDTGQDGSIDELVSALLVHSETAEMNIREIAGFNMAVTLMHLDGGVDYFVPTTGQELLRDAEEQNEDAPSQQSLRFLGFRKVHLSEGREPLSAFNKLVAFLGRHGFRVEQEEDLLVGVTGAKEFGWLWYNAEKWRVTVSYELIILRDKSGEDCYWRLTPHVRGTRQSKPRKFDESDFREIVSVSSLLRRRWTRDLRGIKSD